MSVSHQHLTDFSHFGSHFLRDGLSLDGVFSILPAPGTDMGEPEEVECFRLPLSSLFTVCFGESPELYQPGFAFVQFQSELRQPFLQGRPEPPRIGAVLESHDEVVHMVQR